jgi:hypothetical protein
MGPPLNTTIFHNAIHHFKPRKSGFVLTWARTKPLFRGSSGKNRFNASVLDNTRSDCRNSAKSDVGMPALYSPTTISLTQGVIQGAFIKVRETAE